MNAMQNSWRMGSAPNNKQQTTNNKQPKRMTAQAVSVAVK
jgi:hypothetical protein